MSCINKIIVVFFSSCWLITHGQIQSNPEKSRSNQYVESKIKTKENKMIVEIWSDIVCPYCYIGKVKFEKALEQFPENKNIELIYKGFQLMPDIVTNKDQSVYQLLSEVKGIPMDQVLVMHNQLTQAAKEIGLEYNFDKTIVANTYKAHQFIHFSKKVGKQNEAVKSLFQAYFTDGKNIDDLSTLIQLAEGIGLDTVSLKNDLQNNNFANEVQEDIQEARQIGVRGVPFFVFDRKYAVSGAQDPSVFLETLKKSYSEWQED